MIVIFNPVAGRRRAQSLWRVLDILASSGVRIDLVETQCPGHAVGLARDAAQVGTAMVVAAGGDGTIAEVANGLTGSSAKLGVIPIGTANVLAHELDLPLAPARIAAALAFGRTKMIWPGVISQGNETRLFVQMLGIGFDGYVVHALNRPLKRLFGRGAYVMQTVSALRRYEFPAITLRIDGVETQTAGVIVSKGRFYGGPYNLASDADTTQPGFSVSMFDRTGPLATLLYGAALPVGMLYHLPGIRRMRAAEIEFLGDSGIPVQADGDAAGVTPLRITNTTTPIPIVIG